MVDHTIDQQLTAALERQRELAKQSMRLDRRGWTRAQWIQDARNLMMDVDGADTSLVNGHIMALLDEAQEAGELRVLGRQNEQHTLVYMEVTGSFAQAVCSCGAHLHEIATAGIPAMLAKHIQMTRGTE